MDSMYRWIIFLTLFLVVLQLKFSSVSAKIFFKKGAPQIELETGGIISGKVEFSRDGRPYNSFIGIPYATVPERFQEGQPFALKGVLNATEPGPICSQMEISDELDAIPKVIGEENCLNLNVYVPISNQGPGKKGYPVMVWVHGGGYYFGDGYGYGPQYFMDENVILVTFNYRLGVLGFLSTGDNVIPGNNGLKDMVLALRWVQEKIKHFGGDPGKVTIFGESAGGSAVHHLMLSPTTRELFHRAISQSGTVLSDFPNLKPEAIELATYLNCPTNAVEPSKISSQEILACLNGRPMEELVRAQSDFKFSWPDNMRNFYVGPTTEPTEPVSSLTPFLSEPPISILARRDSKLPEIPWMVGVTVEECNAMFAGPILNNPKYLKEMNSDWNKVAPLAFDYAKLLPEDEQNIVSEKLKKFYFGDKDVSKETGSALINIYSYQMFVHGMFRSALETAARGNKSPVYLYQYTYQGPKSIMGDIYNIKGKQVEKAGHADELQHLFKFDGFGKTKSPNNDDNDKQDKARDEQFSKNIVRLWASFAIHGEPRHSWGDNTRNRWTALSKDEMDGAVQMKWFRVDENAEMLEVDKDVKDRVQFWDGLWNEHFTPAIMAKYKPAGVAGKTEL